MMDFLTFISNASLMKRQPLKNVDYASVVIYKTSSANLPPLTTRIAIKSGTRAECQRWKWKLFDSATVGT